MDVKLLKELELKRHYIANLPFCPDHRDKVKGLLCRQCEIERLNRIIENLKKQIEEQESYIRFLKKQDK